MEPALTDQERSELERQLWRCRGKAYRITGTGRSADPEYAQEFLAALGSLRQRAEAIAGGAAWLEAHLNELRVDIVTRLDQSHPDWREDPPGWVTALCFAPGAGLLLE
jgi:hypothetical protein